MSADVGRWSGSRLLRHWLRFCVVCHASGRLPACRNCGVMPGVGITTAAAGCGWEEWGARTPELGAGAENSAADAPPGLVPRPDLLARLTAAVELPVTLVV